jgi:NAD(P)H-hydrate epimerase
MKKNSINKFLLNRKPNTHKGDYGHVFVIAGSLGMTGAAYLTAQAALLSGSGLVTLGIPKSLNTILARKFVEVMTKPMPETKQQSLSLKAFSEIEKFILSRKPNVLAVGPGLSQNKQTQALIRKIVSSVNLSMVIDADGLNALVGHLDILYNGKYPPHPFPLPYGERVKGEGECVQRTTVITPHPGEMARLLGISVKDVQENRKNIAKETAAKYNIIVVLKGHKTIVASPKGKVYINRTGNPGMASAGCGDVLTGMIASFLGQGIEPFEAAKLGVYLHGLAGDLAAGEVGQASLRATDVLGNIPKAIKTI